ncbi:heavy metal translocating P-type ATPase [Sphingosinicella microcystinivorans]|uniref:Copper-translocating P-type ATPase n=1 Tax=Sphingosinicella microcystinivorans TaxID=335406 RepID=A0AAD1D2R3_SPHMI|nr:heavy metal translocating P-type ATPase [Sphingosinicella microcystinivorans]RKS88938.1 Cu2+-exporting ATPase [Sphingosinicella microcystinivorans]BBE32693.1 copper-translocating P-type ATPase [Sphingosinicella microcystinivorans]
MKHETPVAAAGTAMQTKTSVFAVPGMRCAGCISKLEKGLSGVEGIAAARVNFGAKRVTLTHDPAFDEPALKAVIGKIGFDAEPLPNDLVEIGDGESRMLLRAMAVAGFAAMNIMLLSVSVWSGAEGPTRDMFHWLSALIAIPTIAYSGRPFFRSAFGALRRGRTNMDVPISIGVLLATGLSLFETAISGPHAYFDGAVMLLFFLLTGRWLDSVMRDRARGGVTQLLRQTARGAYVIGEDGRHRWCEARSLAPGMRMHVAAGERLAADGIIEDGTSAFDLSLLTGESAPQARGAGDAVLAGTLNLGAPVVVRASAVGADTAIADIARLMESAGQTRSRYVRVADRAARWYAPAVHTLAALSFAGWMLAGAGWHHSLVIAVAVLIITCPCALGLAVPAAQIVASGALMRRGVLVKDGSALERLSEVTTAAFDKTGTLTLGRPVLVNPEVVRETDAPVLLALASASRHPLADAVRRHFEGTGLVPAVLTDVTETPGEGVTGRYRGHDVRLVRPSASSDTGMASRFAMGAGTNVLLRFEDALRPDARSTIHELATLGIDSSILSGDRTEAVADTAAAIGIGAVAALTPAGKLGLIRAMAAEGDKVLMVGDGLNDGPALAAGHVSMAPGSASDVGQNAADAVFMGDSLAPVAAAIRAARRTMAVVRQNFALAIGYNVIAVPLAVTGHVTPLIAALAMSGSSVIVIANALRLRNAAE